MTYTVDGFCDFLEEYRLFLSELLDATGEKLALVLEGDVKTLELHLKKEQAMAMKIEALEKSRIDFQMHIGFDGMSLSQIIAKCEDDVLREELGLLYGEINYCISAIRELGGHISSVAGERIEDIRLRTPKSESSAIYYDGSGHRSSGKPSTTLMGGKRI